jgi:hypothetical protein
MATETKKDVIRRDFMVITEHEKMALGAYENPSGWHDILYTFAFSHEPHRRTSAQGRNPETVLRVQHCPCSALLSCLLVA